jgi:hypothetical protein
VGLDLPWNHPGWMAIAPPFMGQLVLFREVPMPPPGKLGVRIVYGLESGCRSSQK